jgi:hypothetical protein
MTDRVVSRTGGRYARMSVIDLISSSPAEAPFDTAKVATCIEACFDCARSCVLCADACLAEPDNRGLTACIRLNADCADLSEATARVISRQHAMDPALAQAVLQTCIAVTRLCAQECESHAGIHRHCELCAAACRRCEAACRALLGTVV